MTGVFPPAPIRVHKTPLPLPSQIPSPTLFHCLIFQFTEPKMFYAYCTNSDYIFLCNHNTRPILLYLPVHTLKTSDQFFPHPNPDQHCTQTPSPPLPPLFLSFCVFFFLKRRREPCFFFVWFVGSVENTVRGIRAVETC